jgi:hypothetical protein
MSPILFEGRVGALERNNGSFRPCHYVGCRLALRTFRGRCISLSMDWKIAIWGGLSAAATILTACGPQSPRTYDVAGQRFAVPQEWLFDARVPWLPAPEAGSFTFHLDPTRDPNEIPPHLVLVEAADRVCGSTRTSQIVEVACGREQTTVPIGPPYLRVVPQADYPYEWDYYAVERRSGAGGQPKRLQVAWCTPISPNPARPKGTAICTSVWGVSGLMLNLGFEENELAQLPAMRARATQMLLSWKVR